MKVWEGIQKGKGTDNIFNEIIVENLPNLKRNPETQMKEGKITSSRLNHKRCQGIVQSNCTKIKAKDRILKRAREKR